MHPISDLQIEYSVLSRGIEDGILDTCREPGIGITAYGVLSRGLIGTPKQQYEPGDHRATWPRFQGDNLDHNLDLVAGLQPIADRHGLTLAQLAVAWVLAQGSDIVPLVGMKKVSRVQPAVERAGCQAHRGRPRRDQRRAAPGDRPWTPATRRR